MEQGFREKLQKFKNTKKYLGIDIVSRAL
jgi:hypothetical protein